MRLTGRDVYVICASCEGQFTIVMISLGRTVAALAGYGKTIVARWTFKGPRVWGNGRIPGRMLKTFRLLTRPTLAATSPARPESAKTASSPRDAPYPMQGRNSSADTRFTFHASRFTVPGSDARTMLTDFFSILLEQRLLLLKPIYLTHQLLHAILQTGVVEPKQVQAIQELLSLNLRPLQRSLQPLQLKLDLLPFVNLR